MVTSCIQKHCSNIYRLSICVALTYIAVVSEHGCKGTTFQFMLVRSSSTFCLTPPIHTGEITVFDRPSNATVAAGEEVTFHCRFNGTSDLPLWDIGGIVYSSSRLPAGFQYTEEGLHIAAVWESLNNTKFTCLLIVHDGNGKLSRIQSPPAYLIVYESYDGRNESGNQLPANSPVTITHTVYPTPTSSTNKNCSSDGLKITQCENIAIGKHYVCLST